MNAKKAIALALAAISIAGLAASFRIMWKRSEYEKANRTVQVIVDLQSLMATAENGETAEEIVAQLKKTGATSIGLYELKSKELIEKGAIRLSPPRMTMEELGDQADLFSGVMLSSDNPFLQDRLKEYMKAYFGQYSCFRIGAPCRMPDTGDRLEDMSFGLVEPPLGMEVTPRFFNTPFESEESIRLKLDSLDRIGTPSMIVFDGKSVLGFPTMIEKTAIEIKKHPGWSVGLVEIVAQDGSAGMARNTRGLTIPVHSISEEELAMNPPAKATARYMRAIRERGVRAIYVRAYTDLYGRPPGEALEGNLEYIKKLVVTIKEGGYETGLAKPLKPFVISAPMRALVAAGAVAFCGLLLWSALEFPLALSLLGALGAFAIVFAAPGGSRLAGLMLKLIPLGVGCLVPGLAVARFFLPEKDGAILYIKSVSDNVKAWLFATAITMAGGVFIASMLSNREYFLRMSSFTGVKLAFLAPIAVIFAMYIKKTGWRLSDFMSTPLRYGECIVGGVVMAALALYVIRSGNDGPVGAARFDSFAREAMEAFLIVRPRTKEFLIGHPALLLAGLFPAARGKALPFAILLFGTIGQVSVLNTFCHLHTPIMLSWARLAMGVSIGMVVGMVLRLPASIFSEKAPK